MGLGNLNPGCNCCGVGNINICICGFNYQVVDLGPDLTGINLNNCKTCSACAGSLTGTMSFSCAGETLTIQLEVFCDAVSQGTDSVNIPMSGTTNCLWTDTAGNERYTAVWTIAGCNYSAVISQRLETNCGCPQWLGCEHAAGYWRDNFNISPPWVQLPGTANVIATATDLRIECNNTDVSGGLEARPLVCPISGDATKAFYTVDVDIANVGQNRQTQAVFFMGGATGRFLFAQVTQLCTISLGGVTVGTRPYNFGTAHTCRFEVDYTTGIASGFFDGGLVGTRPTGTVDACNQLNVNNLVEGQGSNFGPALVQAVRFSNLEVGQE